MALIYVLSTDEIHRPPPPYNQTGDNYTIISALAIDLCYSLVKNVFLLQNVMSDISYFYKWLPVGCDEELSLGPPNFSSTDFKLFLYSSLLGSISIAWKEIIGEGLGN